MEVNTGHLITVVALGCKSYVEFVIKEISRQSHKTRQVIAASEDGDDYLGEISDVYLDIKSFSSPKDVMNEVFTASKGEYIVFVQQGTSFCSEHVLEEINGVFASKGLENVLIEVPVRKYGNKTDDYVTIVQREFAKNIMLPREEHDSPEDIINTAASRLDYFNGDGVLLVKNDAEWFEQVKAADYETITERKEG